MEAGPACPEGHPAEARRPQAAVFIAPFGIAIEPELQVILILDTAKLRRISDHR